MKPRLAFIEFASCEGCQLQIANLENELLDLLQLVDVVNFREVMTEKRDDYDIAFVEGSITRPSDVPRLQEIRDRAKVLVAFGACAHLGGVNCLKNFQPMEQVQQTVYGEQWDYFETYPARPLSAVVKVDYVVPGCPIDRNEFLETAKALLMGKTPVIPNRAVCVECKMKDNICVYDKGLTCLGPVTLAGCSANCPSSGNGCIGCRGLVEDPNRNSQKDVLEEHGLTVEEALGQFRIFNGWSEVANEVA